jgi:nitrous oxidase accessory protein NosD
MRLTTRSNNSSTVPYAVHVFRLTKETVEEYVSVKNEVGYKFGTVSLQWYQTGYMGQDK